MEVDEAISNIDDLGWEYLSVVPHELDYGFEGEGEEEEVEEE